MTYEMYELAGLEAGCPRSLIRISWAAFPGKDEPYQPVRLKVCFLGLLRVVETSGFGDIVRELDSFNLTDSELDQLAKEIAADPKLRAAVNRKPEEGSRN